MGKKKYTEQQIQILRDYYPQGDWDKIIPYFPCTTRVNIRATAKRFGIYRDKSFATNRQNLLGNRYGKLTVISKCEKEGYWRCKCDCGNETIVKAYSLIKSVTKSCGCLKHKPAVNRKDFTGLKFGMLTAVERIPGINRKVTYYRCVCDCGRTDIIVRSGNLKSGHVTTCGVRYHTKIDYWNIKHPYVDDKRKYLIYRHVAPNGKSYIGITKQDADRRFQNGIGYKSQTVFWRAIEKYGWDNFIHEIIDENLSEQDACELEIYYINKVYKTLAPNGYNVAEGGNTGHKLVKPIMQFYNDTPVNFFESITNASKVLSIALETIKRHFGKENSVKGYHFEQLPPIHTYDIPQYYWNIVDESHYNIKEIIAAASRETTIARNIKGSKPINQYGLNGEYIKTYSSIIEAMCSMNNGNGGAIAAAVNPNRQGNTAYGFMWRYDDGNHNDIDPVCYKKQRAVIQLDNSSGKIIMEYKSLAETARTLGTSISTIKKCCIDNVTINGYRFLYK